MSEANSGGTKTGRSLMGLVVVAIGALMVLGVVIKMALGFYVHDLPVLMGLLLGGGAMGWVGQKLVN